MSQPTAQEQQMFEFINRMRQAPAAELNFLLNSNDPNIAGALSYFNVDISTLTQQLSQLSPTDPLAWSSPLSDAAIGHNQWMIAANVQSHQVPGEPNSAQRAENAGYTGWSNLGENTFAYSHSVFYGHASFAIDWGNGPGGIQSPADHRNYMMSASFREVGISVTPAQGSMGPLVITQDFGNRFALSGKAWLLGVAFRDFNRNQFYDPGEGLSGITVQVVGANATAPIVTTTLEAGGYQTLLNPGQYQLNFLQDNILLKSESVLINSQNSVNVKRDLVLAPNDISYSLGGDFNGDGKSDILWRHDHGSVATWLMNGANVLSASLVNPYPVVDNSWKIAGTGDFNGDGKSDILWRNNDGSVSAWLMNGANVLAASFVSPDPVVDNSWKIAGTGDFNGDGKSDILWRNINGSVATWLMNGANVLSASFVSPDPVVDNSWKIAGTGDFNGDGKSDILWRNINGSVSTWLMNGANLLSASFVNPDPVVDNSWKIAGIDDFNGDGKSDILWRHDNGSVAAWLMNGANVLAASLLNPYPVVDNSWKITGAGDFNGDGKSDILWRNNDGSVATWLMNGSNVLATSLVGSAENSWQIAAPTI